MQQISDDESGAHNGTRGSRRPRIASAVLRWGLLALLTAGVIASAVGLLSPALPARAQQSTPVVSIVSTQAGREGGHATVNLSIAPVPAGSLSIGYTISFGGSYSGPAADIADFSVTATSSSATASAGSGTASLQIGIASDTDVEAAHEFFTVTLNAPGATAGYQLGAERARSANVTIEEGVCDRTTLVANKLIDLASVSHCAEVTPAHLSAILTLDLQKLNTGNLKAGDFLGLSGVTLLELDDNNMTDLPAGLFNGLSSLGDLRLNDNPLTALRNDAFAGATNITYINIARHALGGNLEEHALRGLSKMVRINFGGAGRPQSLSMIPAGLFAHTPDIQHIYIHSNRLTSLPAGLFSGLTKLEWVEMASNSLTSLPAGLFSGLTKLEVLGIGSNRLTTLPTRVVDGETIGPFHDLSSLKTLKMGYLGGSGGRPTLPAKSFTGLSSLTELVLDDNGFSSLPSGLFTGLSSLKKLDLSNNRFSSLSSGMFTGLSGLTELDLRVNLLTSVSSSGFTGLSSLETLILTHNRISALTDTALFSNSPNLKLIELDNNNISRITAGVFRNLGEIETLRLNNNRLTSLDGNMFTGTTITYKLVINYNSITSLPATIFNGQNKLKHIYLNNNSIRRISANTFHGLGTSESRRPLVSIYLQSNRIERVPSNMLAELLEDNSDFTTLHLCGNPLENLPNGFTDVPERSSGTCSFGDNSITLSVNPASIREDDGRTTFTVTAVLNGLPSTRETQLGIWDYGVAGSDGVIPRGTAVRDIDYTAERSLPDEYIRGFGEVAAIIIPADTTTATTTLAITPEADSSVESEETIILYSRHSRATSPTIRLIDTNTASTDISLDVTPSEVSENGGQASINVKVSLNGAVRSVETPVTLTIASGGTAEQGATKDYTAVIPALNIPANQGSRSGLLRITPVDDGTVESTETIIVQAAATGLTETGAKSATINLLDDDEVPQTVRLSITGPSPINEGGGAQSYTVAARPQGGGLDSELVLTFDLEGTATETTDYTHTLPATLTIPAHQEVASVAFTITPVDDAVVEVDETIIVDATSATTLGIVETSAITLSDAAEGDPADTATISISGPTGEVAEGDDAEFTVTLSHEVNAEVTVAWSATPGTASASDYGTSTGSVIFSANSAAGTTQTITISARDDKLSETSESFSVTLGMVTGDLAGRVSVSASAGSASATISESDPITVEVSGPESVEEGNAATYTVSLSPAGVTPTENLTVNYATSHGTATAADYTAASSALTFTQAAPGSQTVDVRTTEDSLDEGTGESFTFAISSPAGGGGPSTTLGMSSSVTTTITDDDAAPTGITLSVDTATLNEADGATDVTVTATLDGGTTRTTDTAVTVTLSGTANRGSDYAATTTNVTISEGMSSGTANLSVTPTDDDVVERDETIVVDGTAAGAGLTVSSATVTLTDDDNATLTLTPAAQSVNEGSNASFTVELSRQVDAAVAVAWSATAGTASASDYDTASGSVSFAANSAAEATKPFTIPITDDKLSETSESFSVTLGDVTSVLSDQVSASSNSAAVTIAASDPITVSVSGPESVDEGDTATYTVKLSPTGVKPTSDLTVSYATSHGTATAADYTAASSALTFTNTAPGPQTVDVQTTDDAIDEGSGESFTFAISSPTGGGGPSPSLGASSSVTTITDDDAAPTGITLSVNPSEVDESDGATNVTVTATLNGSTTRAENTAVTVTLSGTAAHGADYSAATTTDVTIGAGMSSGTANLAVTPVGDAIVEGNETLVVEGATASDVGLTVSSATVTINDDDNATLSISGPAASVAEGGDAEFTVTLSHDVDAAVTVAWSATSGTASASDYGTASGSVSFAANSAAEATKTFTIAVSDDDLSETSESFSAALGMVTGDLSDRVSVSASAGSASATISESDPITVSVSGSGSVNEGESVRYTVSLSPSGVKPTSDLTVSYATSDGTAAAGRDYVAESGTLTFTNTAPGSQTVDVDTTEDAIDEGSGEDFTFAISSTTGGGGPSPSLGASSSVTTTITDDDTAPTGITLSVDTASLGESDGATDLTVTATLNGGTTRATDTAVTISLAGTATRSADYTATTNDVTIGAGMSSGTAILAVTPTNDAIVEGSETIVVEGDTAAGVGLTVSSATVTLNDDDNATLSITGPAASVAEGGDAEFTVTLSHDVDAAVTVAWSATSGTASAGDYGTSTGSVSFAANSTAGATQTITIAVTDDNLSETSESFSAALGMVTGDLSDRVSVSASAGSASATISENDPITVSVSGPESVDEGNAATYTVSLSPSGVTPTSDLTVRYATSHGTASSDDYTATSSALTFTNTDPGPQTVEVQTTEDAIVEGSGESFTFTISNPAGGGGPSPALGATYSVSTTITDDDNATISISGPTGEVDEGDDAEFTVTLSHQVDAEVAVAWSATSTTASASDYGASSGSVSFAANSAAGDTQTFSISITDDDLSETSESFSVSLGMVTSALSSRVTASSDSVSVTISESDPITVSVSGSTSVDEGDSASYTVSLSPDGVKPTSNLTVRYATSDGAATSADYTATSSALTFTAEDHADRSVSVQTTQDAIVEGSDESFTFTISGPTGGGGPAPALGATYSVSTTITDDDNATLSISGTTGEVDEGADAEFTVTLSHQVDAAVTVEWSATSTTASAGDYGTASGSVTFSANSAAGATKTITIAITDDDLSETAESFSVSWAW